MSIVPFAEACHPGRDVDDLWLLRLFKLLAPARPAGEFGSHCATPFECSLTRSATLTSWSGSANKLIPAIPLATCLQTLLSLFHGNATKRQHWKAGKTTG